ncbi:MAG TPA: carbohydrate ABC transporter permease [Chthoniobacteraceae bacterium]|nr:carbohydrate ABC transporter permease [Chthoniobacteraceae bacterium]
MNPSGSLFRHFGLVIIAMIMTLPFLWMVGTSIKPHHEVESLSLLPSSPHPENYAIVLRQSPDPYTGKLLDLDFPKWYFNSFFIAGWVTFLQVLTSACAAYAFARLEWPGRDRVFVLYLGTMMVPGMVTMLPAYQIMVSLGMVNTYQGLIIPSAFSAFGTFLLRQFMIGIPRSFDEAASIDGANHLQTFIEVILPMSRPGVIALSIFTFLGNFQSFVWPLVMVRDDHLRTIPVGMLSFQGLYGQQTELIMAATVLNVIPLIILFVVMQKQLISGIQLGGVKG